MVIVIFNCLVGMQVKAGPDTDIVTPDLFSLLRVKSYAKWQRYLDREADANVTLLGSGTAGLGLD